MIKNSIITLSGLFLSIILMVHNDSFCNTDSSSQLEYFQSENIYSSSDTIFIDDSLVALTKDLSIQAIQEIYCKSKEITPQELYRKRAGLPHQQVQLLSIAALCKNENCLMINMVSRNLSDLFDLLGYWQSIRSRPLHYFTTHLPTQFLNKETQTKLADEAIAVITSAITFHTTYLARLHENLNSLNNATQIEDIQSCVAQAIGIMDAFFARVLTAPQASFANLEDSYQALIKHHQAIALYQKTFIESLIKYQKPGHFERNWLRYTIAGTVALGSAAFWYTHKDQISQNSTLAYEGIKKLYTEHLIEPMKEIINNYRFNKDAPQTTPQTLDLKVDEKNQKELVSSFLYTNKRVPESEDAKRIGELVVTTGDYSIIENDIKGAWENPKSILNPFSNSGTLYGINLLRYIIETKRTVNILKSEIKSLLDQQSVNFQILLTVPAILSILGIYFSYKVGKNITNDLINDQYNPIRASLLSVENILNNYDKPNLHVPQNQQGMILYLVYKLKTYVSHISKKHQQEQFLHDLKQLESYEFATHQKLATINRMFRTYEFLTFTGHKNINLRNLNTLFGSQEAQHAENYLARVL